MQLPRLINAAIGYVNANNKNKSLLYAVLAKYYYKVEKNPVETIKMARKAVSLQPSNLYHHLNLVKYLINSGYFSEAQKALEVLQKVDTYGQHRAEISRLMNFIKNKQLQ